MNKLSLVLGRAPTRRRIARREGFIAFLLLSVFIGGSKRTQGLVRRPMVFIGLCVVVAASYWSERVIG